MYRYPDRLVSSFHITQLEAINVLIAVRTLCSGLNDKIIQVACDNEAAVSVFSNSRGRDKVLNAVARALWYHAASRNLDLMFIHRPGVDMVNPDILSRAFVDDKCFERASHLIFKNEYEIPCIP